MGRPIFFTANVRDITEQWLNNEISYGRMVELLNEIAEPHIVMAFETGKQLPISGPEYYKKIYKSWKDQT